MTDDPEERIRDLLEEHDASIRRISGDMPGVVVVWASRRESYVTTGTREELPVQTWGREPTSAP